MLRHKNRKIPLESDIYDATKDADNLTSVRAFLKDMVCVVRRLALDGGVEQTIEAARISLAAARAHHPDGDWFHAHL